MATLEDVLEIQKKEGILMAPATNSNTSKGTLSTQTNSTVNFALRNNTSSSNAYAYVTGLDINRNNIPFLLQSDRVTPYYPASPSSTLQPLQANCAISLGAPGTTTTVTVPQAAGGRVWFCQNGTLTFRLNPGPAIVEPSVMNTSDPNYNLPWGFCEFTFNSFQLFVNISYVDFVALPIALQLENTSGTVTSVQGIPKNGLDLVCSQLQAQDAKDNAGWSQLIIPSPSGGNLRALSPNSGINMNSSLFQGYYQSYVDQVWAKYASTGLTVDTQAAYGVVTGKVSTSTGKLTFDNVGGFSQPSAADIFSCSSGAFGYYDTNTDEMANITARLAAAFNRSTLLINTSQPDNENVSNYYQDAITNHYSRICHLVNLDKRGYAFPYDDVGPSSGVDQSGSVYDSNPKLLTITVGGSTTTSSVRLRDMARAGKQLVGGRRAAGHHVRRDLTWDDDSAVEVEVDEKHSEVDLEKGLGRGKQDSISADTLVSSSVMSRSLTSLVPPSWQRRAEAWVARLEGMPLYVRMKPVVDLFIRCMILFMSLSVRAVVSRVSMVLLFLFFYLLMPLAGTHEPAKTVVVHGMYNGTLIS